LFWATQLAAKIDQAKKAKKKVADECTKARGYLAMGPTDAQRKALQQRLEGPCGKEPKCTVDTPEAEVSGEEGGLPCSMAEELARSLRAAGLEPKVVPVSR
jgi:hypothetical protein